MVKRHFGESLFAATFVPTGAKTLLDVGSGAGFPGIPIALSRPEIRVTLAESQGKKAAFLLEVSRQLKLGDGSMVARAETLPVESLFDVVTLRAVDRGHEVLDVARRHVRQGGLLPPPDLVSRGQSTVNS